MPQLNTRIQFDGRELTSVTGLTILSHNPHVTPKRRINISELARTNKSKAHSAFFTERLITVRVGIATDSRAILEQSIDSLHAILQGVEKELTVSQSGTNRKYYTTLSEVQFVVDTGSYAEINLVFTCSDRFGYDTVSTPFLAVAGSILSVRSDNVTFGGSAEWQLPVFTITYIAISGGTSKTVTLGNNNTGQRVTIDRTWTTGEVLVVDAYNGTVKVNGVAVAFDGAIPEFAPGGATVGYSDNFTTRTVNLSGTYVKRHV